MSVGLYDLGSVARYRECDRTVSRIIADVRRAREVDLNIRRVGRMLREESPELAAEVIPESEGGSIDVPVSEGLSMALRVRAARALDKEASRARRDYEFSKCALNDAYGYPHCSKVCFCPGDGAVRVRR